MTIRRCSVTLLFALAASTQLLDRGVAQNYPAKPIRYIVPSSPGGGNDYIARIFTEELSQAFGRQVVAENRAGAAGNIAAEMVAKLPADGYTLLQISQSLAVNVSLYRDLRYDLVRDFTGVTLMAIEPYIVVVHPSLPVKSISDLIRIAKARPGTLNYPSSGTGTTSFLAAELFKYMAGIDMVHVPYKGGGPALISVVAGETTVYFAPIPPARPHVQQGRLRALAVATEKRLATLAELLTIAESGVPGYEMSNWFGLLVHSKTPKEIVATIYQVAIGVLTKPAFNRRLADIGYVPETSQADQFGSYIKDKIAILGQIVRQTGATTD